MYNIITNLSSSDDIALVIHIISRLVISSKIDSTYCSLAMDVVWN